MIRERTAGLVKYTRKTSMLDKCKPWKKGTRRDHGRSSGGPVTSAPAGQDDMLLSEMYSERRKKSVWGG